MALLWRFPGPGRSRLLLAIFLVSILFLLYRNPSRTLIPTVTSPGSPQLPPPDEQHYTDGLPLADSNTFPALPVPGEDGGQDKQQALSPPIINGPPRARLTPEMQQILEWNPPVEIQDHYPHYDEYFKRDFDPNRWETFEQENAYFYNGSLRQLPVADQKPIDYTPYPAYNSAAWKKEWEGTYVPCHGPGGTILSDSPNSVVKAYRGPADGFPHPDTGSFEAVGLDAGVCFDRFSRLGPYGLSADSRPEGPEGFTPPRPESDFRDVHWGQLQTECLRKNQDRFVNSASSVLNPGMALQMSTEPPNHKRSPEDAQGQKQKERKKKRSAVLIRTWDNYEYKENDIQAIRSLISELSILSGGEYHVFLFVHVKDMDAPIFSNEQVYREAVELFVPEEFRDITILWSEQVCQQWYPFMTEWSVYWMQFMPLQWFSKTHPEFDYVWNWEMDARYIGQTYHFVEQVAKFAKEQPRKYLWERNSRYFFPKYHGLYKSFVEDTHRIVESSPYVETVWGPQPWTEAQVPVGPQPPTTEEKDQFEWGVGEEADFITLLPLWDPRDTWWSYHDKLWGYPEANGAAEDRKYPHVPRRVFINTLVRFSKTLLSTMHDENKVGFGMASEMWPATIALQHGLKAVYAPHPIWFAQKWPTQYLEYVFNADGWGAGSLPGGDADVGRGRGYNHEREKKGLKQQGTGPNNEGLLGRWAQERDSPYSPDREHNFAGWSWYFWSDFPKVLYWRWLGWKSAFQIVTFIGTQNNDVLADVDWSEWERERGRLCYPGMLLHPVKNVQPPE